MRRTLAVAISVAVVLGATGALFTTAASGQTVLHVVTGQPLRVKVVDVHRDGLKLGDRIAGRVPLLEESGTDRVGTGYMQCLVHRRIIDPDQGLWNCNYVLQLGRGDIVLQGLDPRGPGEYLLAVLGGTGVYAGASGEATFTDVDSNGEGYTDMVIRLDN